MSLAEQRQRRERARELLRAGRGRAAAAAAAAACRARSLEESLRQHNTAEQRQQSRPLAIVTLETGGRDDAGTRARWVLVVVSNNDRARRGTTGGVKGPRTQRIRRARRAASLRLRPPAHLQRLDVATVVFAAHVRRRSGAAQRRPSSVAARKQRRRRRRGEAAERK